MKSIQGLFIFRFPFSIFRSGFERVLARIRTGIRTFGGSDAHPLHHQDKREPTTGVAPVSSALRERRLAMSSHVGSIAAGRQTPEVCETSEACWRLSRSARIRTLCRGFGDRVLSQEHAPNELSICDCRLPIEILTHQSSIGNQKGIRGESNPPPRRSQRRMPTVTPRTPSHERKERESNPQGLAAPPASNRAPSPIGWPFRQDRMENGKRKIENEK